jgi:hypothetical protein
VIQRIKNWWKARWDKDFRERSQKVQESYEQMKEPLGNLIQQLQQFENAAQSQSADEAARVATQLPGVLAEIIKEMRELRKKVQSVDSTVPVTYVNSETGEELTDEQRRWVAKSYKKNKELLAEMWEALPPMFRSEIPIGKPIRRQISDFAWYREHKPENVDISETVKSRLKQDLFGILRKEGFGDDAIEILETSYPYFLDNLKEAMVSTAVLMSVNWPHISKQVSHRPANQMKLHLNVNEVPFPIQLPDGSETSIDIGVGDVLAIDMGAALAGTNFKISVMGVRGLSLSPDDKARLESIKRKNDEIHQRQNQTGYVAPTPAEEQEFIDITDDEPIDITDDAIDVTDDEPPTTASGPITSLVKKALVRKYLPTTQAVVKVAGQTFHHKTRFAKVLSSALRQEIGAECSVHQRGDDVEVQVAVAGSKFTAIPAIYGISMYVADQFLDVTKVGVDVDVVPGISSFGLMKSDVLDQSLRKVSFDQLWRLS